MIWQKAYGTGDMQRLLTGIPDGFWFAIPGIPYIPIENALRCWV